MKANLQAIQERLARRKPSSIKNPRKLKKAWKGAMLKYIESQNAWDGKWKLHWVPRNGWTITVIRPKLYPWQLFAKIGKYKDMAAEQRTERNK